MARTARIKLDPFLMAIIAAAVVESFLPATGIGAQVLSVAKSDSIKVELGKELQDMNATYSPKPGGAAALALRFIQKVDEAVNNLRR